MKKMLRIVLVCLLIFPAVGSFVGRDRGPVMALEEGGASRAITPRQATDGLEPDLIQALEEAAPNDTLRVIVLLDEQADAQALTRNDLPEAMARIALVRDLQSLAERSQASLRAVLDREQGAGRVRSYSPFWIVNGIAVEAVPAVVRELARHPSVSSIQLDHYRRWLPELDSRSTVSTPNLQSTSWNLQSAPSNLQSAQWNISRVRAPEVWSSLHISGTGVVVASLDSGVDWMHPALVENYRGYNPHGVHNHAGNWFDAVTGSLYPLDDNGHGTHTLGTVAGQGGIGVAPGAQWIGAKVFSRQGYGYDSWIHAGFQWLLAPGDDPARAPDVVNCSWGNNNGWLTSFQADVQMLHSAGIMTVFSAGNAGPEEQTVGSPASLPGSFAVGATDRYNVVTGFSSRGPSPWEEIRPHVAAPGVYVRSSLPGGTYGEKQGTSMAAPHVSGVVALLRSADPALSVPAAMAVITGTAAPLGEPVPNNDTGWGLLDAFSAVAAIVEPGFITGTVTQAADGSPLAGAAVRATPQGGGAVASTIAGDDGSYLLALEAGMYNLRASAFGYNEETLLGVEVTTNTVTIADFELAAKPTGTVRGRITDASTGQPVTATVAVLDTPLEATASAYTLTLPSGSYTLSVRALGYRVVFTEAVVAVGNETVIDLVLTSIPSILLVDSGEWYYGTQIDYYRQAFDDLSYAYDEWIIRWLPDEVPTAADLTPYDIVVWTAPRDAPGFIGAQETITGYLSSGGFLFLSGQDIGYLDGGMIAYHPYYQDSLKARLVNDSSHEWVLQGSPGGPFEGLTVDIQGAGGADNQAYPDEIAVADPDSAVPVFAYQGGGCGGLRASICLDYRLVYLSFGFEAITDRGTRREVMERAVDWLVATPPEFGLEVLPHDDVRISSPGSLVTYTLRVRHLGQSGVTDTVALSLDGVSWPTQMSSHTLSLAPCTSDTVTITATVPSTASWDMRDTITFTARSSISPTVAVTAILTTKAPAPVLLVDDDRWYEQMALYEATMADAGLSYDVWQTGPALGGGGDTSPPVDVLEWYPVVAWWTGYDWYRPVTVDERATLAAYLAGGGRLFLSSQDFLYYHHASTFTRDYLGVLNYTEIVTPTQAAGVPENPITGGMGPWELDYPRSYQNWSDGVEPMPGTDVFFRDQNRLGMALAHRDDGHATAFLAFPFEALPEGHRPEVMASIIGWLSWLGRSGFSVDRATVSAGGSLSYTLRLENDGPVTVTASLSNTLPAEVALVSGSLAGPASYDALARRVTGTVALAPGAAVTVTYGVTVTPGLAAGTSIVNAADLALETLSIRFRRAARARVESPDLSPSAFWFAPSPATPDAVVTGTLALHNGGLVDAPAATAVHTLPVGAELVTGSLAWSGGGSAEALTGTIRWNGPLSVASDVTVTYQFTFPRDFDRSILYGVAFAGDGLGGHWERPAWLWIEPHRVYLPVMMRE